MRQGYLPGHSRRTGNRHPALTTLRAGTLGSQDDRARTEMFIDCSPYMSLAGFGLHHHTDPAKRSDMAAKNPRGATDFGDAARNRSRGKPSGGSPHETKQPTNSRGAPPIWPSRMR